VGIKNRSTVSLYLAWQGAQTPGNPRGAIHGIAGEEYTVRFGRFSHNVQAGSANAMPDKFDPYREALVMETVTVWPDEYEALDPARRLQLEQALHADPQQCANLEYVRTHTGFCRKIVVTPDDMQRLGA
jgi:hypothetical protein